MNHPFIFNNYKAMVKMNMLIRSKAPLRLGLAGDGTNIAD